MKILSINGGGSTIYVFACLLAKFEKDGLKFDRIHGVSAGAILGAMLASGRTASECVPLAKNFCSKIFKRTWLGYLPWKSKYSTSILENTYRQVYGNTKFGDLKQDFSCHAVCISGQEIEPRFWKSWENKDVTLFDAIRASSAAPTYFDPHTVNNETFIDGGLVANNPSMCALADAIKVCPIENISILNIQGGERAGFKDSEHKNSIVDWIADIASVGIYGCDNVVQYQVKQLIGNRYQVLIPPSNLSIDSLDFELMEDEATEIYINNREKVLKLFQ